MSLLQKLPRGATLTEQSLAARYRIVHRVLLAHLPLLWLVGLLGPAPTAEAVLLPLGVAALATAAGLARSWDAKVTLASLGLIATSFEGIELSGGQVHAHLHLFAVLAFVALFQRWGPLLLTVVLVAAHHLLLGLLAPEHVFGMMATSRTAVLAMVTVHALCVLLEVAGILYWWAFAEQTERSLAAGQAAAQAERDSIERERQAAVEREAAAERERATRLEQVSRQVGEEADQIRVSAGAAVAAVATVEHQVQLLTAAVRGVAERAARAASTASAGQQMAGGAAEEVSRLERSMGEIADVNQMIAQLADQTNLLSLNATIEAARAGEMGKGFAVVASEVKALANETSTSAGKVSAVIDAVVGETEAVARSFAATSGVVGEIHGLQADIASSVAEQSQVLEAVGQHLETVTAATRAIVEGLERMTRTTAAW